ncbi:hypothetical protein GCM10028808_26010 [Spirosoma migulaei]
MGEVLRQYYDPTDAIRQKSERWIARSTRISSKNNYLQDGKDFENQILEDLKDTNSAVYQKLKKDWVTDLDDRQILSQVQFCLDAGASSCTQKGGKNRSRSN